MSAAEDRAAEYLEVAAVTGAGALEAIAEAFAHFPPSTTFTAGEVVELLREQAAEWPKRIQSNAAIGAVIAHAEAIAREAAGQ